MPDYRGFTERNYEGFIATFDSENSKKVARSLKQIGKYDYENCTPIDLEQIVLSMKPNSPKAITTIVYMLSLYAKYLNNDNMYYMTKDIDRNALWSIAKPLAKKKFISHSTFENVYKEIGVYEEYNSFYLQTLFLCLYEGIYNDDMSVIKNLKASDIHIDTSINELANKLPDGKFLKNETDIIDGIKRCKITLKEDNGHEYDFLISNRLAEDLIKLGNINIWERKNRFGTCRIKITGIHKDSCFKVETRKDSSEYSYRYTYYRMLRKISKEYLEYNLLPLQLYVSGMMHRIKMNLKEHDIELEEAFSSRNKNRIVNKIISEELKRCNCDTEVKNFREMVIGHLDVFV